MKKLFILILICLPVIMFAQNSQAVNNVIFDNSNNSYVDLKTASIDDNKLVFATPNEEFASKHSGNKGKTVLESPISEIPKDNRLLYKEILVEDTKTYLREGMATYSKDRKTVYFSANRKIKSQKTNKEQEVKIKKAVNLRLFKADVNENGDWENLEMLSFNSNNYSTGQPVLNHDDTKLYFVSDGPESLGRTDIFVVDLYEDGTYGKPINMGPKINSSEREIFPYIDKDDLLFFSSDVRNKPGNLDVYACKVFDNTVSVPVKLKGYVNIEKDDFTYYLNNEKQVEYLSSSKQSAIRIDDIYANADSSPIDTECKQEVFGVVRNVDTQELLPDVQIMLYDENDRELLSLVSNEMDASFSFEQSCNTSYKLKGYHDGYLIRELDIKTVNDLDSEPLEIIVDMRVDSNTKEELIVDLSEEKQVEESKDEIDEVETSGDDESSIYDFNSNVQVYTVQIGAFNGDVNTEQYNNLSNLFNHNYDDGFNRYFSGVFESDLEARNYMKQLKKSGYKDAFIVRLKGEKRL